MPTTYLIVAGGGGGDQNLQEVTDKGSATSNKVAIGTGSGYTPYNYLEIYGTTQIQDRTTTSDGIIQLGDQTDQTIKYSTSEAALKLGAGITSLKFDFGGTIGIGTNNTDPIGNSYYSIELSMVAEANGSSDYFEAYAYMHQAGDFRSTSGENLFLGYKLIGA